MDAQGNLLIVENDLVLSTSSVIAMMSDTVERMSVLRMKGEDCRSPDAVAHICPCAAHDIGFDFVDC